MPLEPLSPQAFAFIAQIDEAYTSLARIAADHGGHLLYAGELNEPNRALTIAANIAGAATLAATANASAAKQAMRDGVIDFLVTSLDEALRILKNEIRKRQPVAVCVSASPESIEKEMQDRGVLPDLVAPSAAHVARNAARPPHILKPVSQEAATIWLTWRVTESPAQWLPKIDAIAIAALASAESPTLRWLQLAPRYLGRLTQNTRILHTAEAQAHLFIEQLKSQLAAKEIRAAIEIHQGPWGDTSPILLEPL